MFNNLPRYPTIQFADNAGSRQRAESNQKFLFKTKLLWVVNKVVTIFWSGLFCHFWEWYLYWLSDVHKIPQYSANKFADNAGSRQRAQWNQKFLLKTKLFWVVNNTLFILGSGPFCRERERSSGTCLKFDRLTRYLGIQKVHNTSSRMPAEST